MEREMLIEAIKTTLTKTKVTLLTHVAAEEGFSVKELVDLTFHQDEKIAFRAAWILENIYEQHFHRFLPYATYFLDRFIAQQNLSCCRHYSKILALMTSKRAPTVIKNIIDNYETTEIVATVFGWLINDQIPVAIKSHCLNVLANLSVKHDWIKDELLETMDFLVDKESIGFYSKVKKIRKQLKVLG